MPISTFANKDTKVLYVKSRSAFIFLLLFSYNFRFFFLFLFIVRLSVRLKYVCVCVVCAYEKSSTLKRMDEVKWILNFALAKRASARNTYNSIKTVKNDLQHGIYPIRKSIYSGFFFSSLSHFRRSLFFPSYFHSEAEILFFCYFFVLFQFRWRRARMCTNAKKKVSRFQTWAQPFR